jgi:hypothetical protein
MRPARNACNLMARLRKLYRQIPPDPAGCHGRYFHFKAFV